MKNKTEPFYDLAKVQKLVKSGKYFTSIRLRKYLTNQGFVTDETIEDVICSIQSHHYYKTDELQNRPGIYADIYRHIECYEIEWYVKFFFDKEEEPCLSIWSLKEDGYQF